MLLLAFGVCVALGLRPAVHAQPLPVSSPKLAPIRTMADFWSSDRRNKSQAIDLEGTAIYYDPHWGNLWGEIDGQVGFLPFGPGLPIRSGERFRMRGTVTPPNQILPGMVEFTVLEQGKKHAPLDARGKIGDFNRFKGQVVTLEAIVNRQELTEPQHVMLRLVADGYRIHLYHWDDTPEPLPVKEGDVVRVTGLYNPMHESRTETMEIDLWVADRADIQIIGNLERDQRFDLPVTAIDRMPEQFNSGTLQIRVAGEVTAYSPGKSVTLRDGSGQVLVRTLQTLPLRIGDAVEAIGLPFTGGADWTLRNSLVRSATPEVLELMQARAQNLASSLRLAEQVLELEPQRAAEAREVDLMGIVIRSRLNTGFLFLRDTSGTVRVELGELESALLKNGTGLRIRGRTVSGRFAPAVRAESLEFWGGAILPEARPVTLEQAMTGQEEGERIELKGYVAQLKTDAQFSRVTLSTTTGEFTAVLSADEATDDLLGSIVSVRGICQAIADDQRRLVGIELWASTRDDIRIEQAALQDPFSVPARSLAGLRQFALTGQNNYWVRIRGVVTHSRAGRFVYVQDGSDGLMLLTQQTDRLEPGDVIEATGLLGIESRRIVLREAVYRQLGRETPPPAAPLGDARRIHDQLEDALVEVRGELLSAVNEQDSAHLLVQAQDHVFSAFVPNPGGTALPHTWAPGSTLELHGIYAVIRDERRRAKDFQLQLRSPADVLVLHRPSWWTPQRAFLITGGLCVCITGGMGWLVSLRRRVRQQTTQIRQQLQKEANLEARHRDLFEKASDFIFTIDREGRFTSFNPGGEKLTGYPIKEALRLTIFDLLDERTGRQARQVLRRPGTVEDLKVFQTRLRRRDGSLVWVEANVRIVRQGLEPTGALAVLRDISERKQIEEQLTRARDAAEANTRMKSTFLANMSHEIRTPMNGVIGMSNLLLDTKLENEQREFAETIRSSAESLLTVLNDILDFSKIEAGKLQFETLPLDPVDAVEGAVELLAPRAAAKKIELAAYVSPDVPRNLRGDPGRLRQVLLNLLGNALKFTERGEIVLHVMILEQTDRSAVLRFEIADTGVGMPQEAVAKLFQPFHQADASTTRRFGGTGLGLAIAKQLVELMHGTIGVHSQLGRGSTFWFNIPLEKSAEAVIPETLPDEACLKGLRVLGVDDLQVNRRIVSHHAQAWGMRCEVVGDARDALVRLRAAQNENDPFRLVISDFQMPEMDGVMLARAIRDEPTLEKPAFVLFTSLDRRLAPHDVQELGIGAIVMKPIRVAELLNGVRRALGMAVASSVSRPAFALKLNLDENTPAARILVAEDNTVNQRVITMQLQKLGYSADVAANGFEVLDALERRPYTVILMDCQMPDMDGYEATRRIRASRHRDVRIIALTANAMEGDRERCLEAGMDDYLSKPTRPTDLAIALRKVGPAPAAAAAA